MKNPELYKKLCSDALLIYAGGACNPSGICRTLVEMSDFGRTEVGNNKENVSKADEWAPFRLALAQVSWLAGQGIGYYDNVRQDEELAMKVKDA